jgi:hypothetical protein
MHVAIVAVAVALADLTSGTLRVHNERLRDVVRVMLARSATFRAMVDRLERSNVFVYIEVGQCPNSFVVSCANLMGGAGGYRYVRVAISLEHEWPVIACQIAHELQHALEIAEAPDVIDERSLAGLYRRIGHVSGVNSFETIDALAVQRRVCRELR